MALIRWLVYLPPSIAQLFVYKRCTKFRLLTVLFFLLFPACLFVYYYLRVVRSYCLDQYAIKGVPKELALAPMSPSMSVSLYQALHDLSFLLRSSGLSPLIGGPTLLAAVRHRGLIPWNTNTELLINIEQITDAYTTLATAFRQSFYPYRVSKSSFGLRIRPLDQSNGRAWIIKIFAMNYEGKIYRYDNNEIQAMKKSCVLYRDEIEPIREYSFGSFKLPGPGRPHDALQRCYGQKYMSQEMVQYEPPNKSKECVYPVQTYLLSPTDLVPSFPQGPIRQPPGRGSSKFDQLFQTHKHEDKGEAHADGHGKEGADAAAGKEGAGKHKKHGK